MALGIGKLDDLVLDRRAVARSAPADRAAVQCGFLQVSPNDLLHYLAGPGDPAWQLPRPLNPLVEREAVIIRVSVFALDLRPIDAAPVDPRRGPGLEARCCKSKCINMLRDIDRRLIASAPRRDLRIRAEMDPPAQEGPGRDDDGARAERPPVAGDDSCDARALEDQSRHHALRQLDVRKRLEQGPHGAAVQRPVALRAWGPDSRPLGAVEHPELDRRAIGGPPHDPAEGIDLAHHGALRDPADGGIAGHVADGVEVGGEQESVGAQAGGHDGGFRAGMTGAYNDYIIHDAHEAIIPAQAPRRRGDTS